MKLAGFLQIYNEESKGNLRRCLDSMSKYCDIIGVYDDASTDGSADVAEGYDKVILIRGTRNEFDREMSHKQELLSRLMSESPDWFFWLDADEVIEKRGEDGGLREIAESSDRDAHDFRQINFWRSERYYRVDGQYNSGIFCRLWRNNKDLSFSTEHGLHKKPYPDGIRTIRTEDLRILHYGFGSSDAIVDKYRTYKSYGQSGWDLDRLVCERGLRLAATKDEWLGRQPVGPTAQDIEAEGWVKDLL